MTKLGARILSDGEMELILPNWKAIDEQIEVFRRNINTKEEQKNVQKTNNIGIMGHRGAGKTSVLRTFREKLEIKNSKREHKDIILPIVIPENMSEGNSLMDVILGMFKECLKKEEKKTEGACIYHGKKKVEKCYSDMIKLYCYIREDFRNILIQQFTTEQYYLEKTTEIFNSDTEFINKFNEFIDALVGNEEGKDSLIFLFIDDIDLSTTRCIDIVKTLLSYLSNQRIVTFISGDIETFEEGLTLDFLRQEQALDEKVFSKTYFESNESNSLLVRKKKLAYEYLKKIIPPAYRYSIKLWAESDRGNYKIESEAGSGEDKGKALNLCELLCETVGKKIGKLYFSYSKDDGEHNFPYTYCMFDETSRGLNNVYNVLQKLYQLEKVESSEEMEQSKVAIEKNLLETILDSKPFYAKYKDKLLNQVIIFETDVVRINLKEIESIIWVKDEKREDVHLFKEKLALFVLLDFCIRLFEKNYLKTEKYKELKKAIMEEMIASFDLNDGKADKIEEKDKKKQKSIISNFFLEGDFIFNLYFLMNCKLDKVVNLLKNSKNVSINEVYKMAVSLSETVECMSKNKEEKKELIIDLYEEFSTEISFILNQLSLDQKIIFVREILEGLLSKIEKSKYYFLNRGQAAEYLNMAARYIRNVQENQLNNKDKNMDIFWADYYNRQSRYWMFYENARDTSKKGKKNAIDFTLDVMEDKLVSNGIIKFQSNLMDNFMQGSVVKSLDLKECEAVKNRKEDGKEWQALFQIDKNSFWKIEYTQKYVKDFLEKNITEQCKKALDGRIVFDATELFYDDGAYKLFEDCDKGVTNTFASKLFNNLERISEIYFKDADKKYLSLEQIMVMQCFIMDFLNKHPRARYGKFQARKLLMSLQEVPIVIRTEKYREWERMFEEKEDEFFMKEFEEMRGIYDKYIYNLRRKYDLKVLERSLRQICHEELRNLDWRKIDFIIYRFNQQRIEEIKQGLETGIVPAKMEKEVDLPKFQFSLHCYMRYLQANNDNLKEIGNRAEKIAELAELLNESEVLAEQRQQKEMFELLSKTIELKEEEFEELFM